MLNLTKSNPMRIVLAVLLVAVFAGGAMSQDVATGEATATVQVALQVAWAQDLDFGTVFQGVSKAILHTDAANGGTFTIDGEPSAGISLYMQLPDYLSTATGDDRMVVSFGSTDCSIDTSSSAAAAPRTVAANEGFPDQNPHNMPSGVSVGTSAGDVSTISLYMGGTVLPTVDQKAGAYIGDIILTVAYNGT